MNLKELMILQVMTRTCFASFVIDISKREETFNLVKAAVKILMFCYENGTMAIAGKSTESLIAPLSSKGPVVIIDDTTRSVDTEPVSELNRHELHLFMITTSSSMELEEILVKIRSSRWWNHMGHFYILDYLISENGCSKAHEYLWMAWRKNLLDVKFVCIDGEKGPLIYTFNPYTREAPEPWKFVETHRGYHNHPWTLLVRQYREDHQLICQNMSYERTKNLGGYPIRVLKMILSWDTWLIHYVPLEHRKIVENFYSKLFSSLNVTPIYTKVISEIDVAKRREISTMIDNEESDDVELISRDRMMPENNRRQTYPHHQTGLCIVTQYRGDESQFEKFLHVMDFSSRVCMCLVGLVTLIYLKIFVRQAPGIAALNLIRMICNAAIRNLRNNTATRIYVACLMIFVVTIQGIYQGRWAAILAKRKPLRDIDTMQDLVESDYKIYVSHVNARYFDDPVFQGRMIVLETIASLSLVCEDYVLEDSSVACVNSEHESYYSASFKNLHVSSEPIVKMDLTLSFREDWPLKERFNLNIQRLVEAGIFQHLYGPFMAEDKRKIEANNNRNTERVVKVLTLDDLNFAFFILGIGLGCATICFIIEMTIVPRGRAMMTTIFRSTWNRATIFRRSRGKRLKKIERVLRNPETKGISNILRRRSSQTILYEFTP